MRKLLFAAALAANAAGAWAQSYDAAAELETDKGRMLAGIKAQAAAVPGLLVKSPGPASALERAVYAGAEGLLPGDEGRRLMIDAVWALGETGGPGAEAALDAAFEPADRTTRLNITAALAKLRSRAKVPSAEEFAAAAAHMEPGDIVFRKGYFGLLNPFIGARTVGHVGVYAGVENGKPMIIEGWVPVRKAPLEEFAAGWPFYGNYTTLPKPTAAQREQVLKYSLAQLGKAYDYLHSGQKGPLSFDCVGLAEAAYESAGLNPTPDEFETGWGWPLTPTEQYEHTFPNF